MTTIAWDGTTLAADTQSTLFRFSFGKICRLKDGSLFGQSGHLSHGQSVIAWLNGEGEKPGPEERFHAILIRNGVLHIMESNLFPVEYRSRQAAVGSGRDFAMAAMYLGKTAAEAVLVAHAMDTDTGPEVEILEYSPAPTSEAR